VRKLAPQSKRDAIAGWLSSAGYLVTGSNAGLPSTAEWGLLVTTPPPMQVKLRVIGLKGDKITCNIAVSFSPRHRELVSKLDMEEKVRFSSELMLKLLSICPHCRIAIQGGLQAPQAVIAEILLDEEELTKQRLLDDVARLVNIFLAVNSMLWSLFPREHAARQKQEETPSFM